MPGPGPSLRQLAKEDRPSAARETAVRLAGFLAPYKRELIFGTAWLVVSSAAVAATPALTGRLIDAAVRAASRGSGTSTLTVPALLLVGSTLVGWYAQRMQILTFGTAGQKALYDVRKAVFAKVLGLDVGYFEAVESGDLMSRLINDIEQVNSFLSQGLRRLVSAAFALVATLGFMLWVDLRLALATLLVVPVMLAVTRLFGIVARRAFKRRQESIGDVSATLAEELDGIKVAQAFNRTGRNRTDFADRNAANRDANIGAATVSSAFSPVLSVISTGATALVAGLGAWSASRGLVTIGVVVAFLNYARQFFNAVTQLSSLYSETQSALAGGERVLGLIDARVRVCDPIDPVPLEAPAGRIELCGVRFAYPTGPEVLHGIDLVVAAGESIAIVGETGAGKSTLVNLVPRFYDATAGTVLFDGVDVRRYSVAQLRSAFGIVLQEPFLFSGTLRDNVRYGMLEATDERILAALETAGASSLMDTMPEGLDTPIGERGATLSTGQRQLIAFARAVVGDPAVLILDEATSSVDTRTELLIQRGLRGILAGRTALIIAHRLSTVRDADRIVVLASGRIVEQGTYAELLARGGAFARLHEAQFGR